MFPKVLVGFHTRFARIDALRIPRIPFDALIRDKCCWALVVPQRVHPSVCHHGRTHMHSSSIKLYSSRWAWIDVIGGPDTWAVRMRRPQRDYSVHTTIPKAGGA
jgi:hypothetical protein